MENFLELAIKVSLEAGEEILKIYTGDFSIDWKLDQSPLTLADKKSHQIILEGLSITEIPLLSEEGKDIPYENRSKWDYFWLVDPLDGTKEFINRNGEFTINISLIHKSRPMLGVIYVPVKGLLYYALKNKGAYRVFVEEDDSIEGLFSRADKLPLNEADGLTAVRVVASKSHLSPETQAYVDRLRGTYKDISFRSAGSSLKFCLVAEGEADIYPRYSPTMEWDTAAGDVIVEEAEGKVIDVESGKSLIYNKRVLKNPYFVAVGGKIKSLGGKA
ncbi:MAG: 3'(2'),5'-bisphosphate nucleotidase CysQ [Aquificaceae bacterium]